MEGSNTGTRTVRDMCLYRGRLALFTSNCPRYRPLAWMVQPLDPEPSMIQAQSVEGPRLDTEPSMIWGIIVEGSVLENVIVRDMEH